jgi:hypothetical protein
VRRRLLLTSEIPTKTQCDWLTEELHKRSGLAPHVEVRMVRMVEGPSSDPNNRRADSAPTLLPSASPTSRTPRERRGVRGVHDHAGALLRRARTRYLVVVA